MAHYRFEILDAKGDISERRYIECDDKNAALERAGIVLAQISSASGVDVWDGGFLVRCLKKAVHSAKRPPQPDCINLPSQ